MDHYLGLHPDIFMATKEIHYFGSDLGIKQDPMNEQEYLDQFASAMEQSVLGESSVWYLYSRNAAAEIKKFNPEARILVMLRNPVELLPSLHDQFRYDGDEDKTSFTEAWGLDENRSSGKDMPLRKNFEHGPFYIDTVQFAPQIKRYYDQFNNEQIHILLFDELVADIETAFISVLNFLGVDENFRPSFEAVNEAKEISSQMLHRQYRHPDPLLRSIFQAIVPVKGARNKIMETIKELNVSKKKDKSIPDELRNDIIAKVKPSVTELQDLLQRDLSSWLS